MERVFILQYDLEAQPFASHTHKEMARRRCPRRDSIGAFGMARGTLMRERMRHVTPVGGLWYNIVHGHNGRNRPCARGACDIALFRIMVERPQARFRPLGTEVDKNTEEPDA